MLGNAREAHASNAFGNFTPIHMAAKNGHLIIVQFLANNVTVHKKSHPGLFGQTAYEVAVIRNKPNVEKFLARFVEPKIVFPNERKCDSNGFPGF